MPKQRKKQPNFFIKHSRVVAAFVIVAGISMVGYFGYVRSSAATFNESYSVGVQARQGCLLSGREWNADKDQCLAKCRLAKVDYLRTDTKPVRGYCKSYVNTDMPPERCISELHRYYITDIGCSRRSDQENTNEARQCIDGYPNYIADRVADKCVAQEIVHAQTGAGAGKVGSGTPSGETPTTGTTTDTATPATVAPPATNSSDSCTLLGRIWDKKAKKCQNTCDENAGTLVIGLKSGVKYCNKAIAVTQTGTENVCVNKLHRVWLVEGCARRPDQTDSRDMLRCQPGYPYYNANYNNILEDTATLRDVCEKSKGVAAVNEETGTPGLSTTLPPTSTSDPDGSGGVSSNGTQDEEDDQTAINDVSSAFKIAFFKKTEFKGKALVVTAQDSKLPKEWTDSIKSYKIISGRWELCDGPGFNGDCIERWASDPDVALSERTGKLSEIVSLRPVMTTTYEDPSEDVVADCTTADGTITQPNADNTCPAAATLTCPEGYTYKDGECKEVVITEQASAPVDQSFKGDVGERDCLLLGREWIAKSKNKILNGGNYGCSTVTCNLHIDGAPKKNNGKPYCVSTKYNMPYAVEMKQNNCEELHRVWIDAMGMCAQLPGPRDKIKATVNAKQCMPGFTTYYSFVAKNQPDECFKPSTVDKAKGVVKATGGVLSSVLQAGPRAYCLTVKHDGFTWDAASKTCKADREGGGSAFKIASFNIYYNTDDSHSDYSINQWQERLQRSVRVIKSNGIAVAGLQEVRQSQWQRLQDKDRLGGDYGIFPRVYKASVYASQNPIVWDKSRFELIESGSKTIVGPHVTTEGLSANSNTQVELRDKATGQRFYVINTHEPVGNGGAIQARYNSAKNRAAYVKELAKQGKPIFLTGDFNAKYNPNNPRQQTKGGQLANMSYCVLTDGTGLWDALDAAHKHDGGCKAQDGPVDHVFLSRSVSVLKYDYSSAPHPGNGSDSHNTLIVNAVIKP